MHKCKISSKQEETRHIKGGIFLPSACRCVQDEWGWGAAVCPFSPHLPPSFCHYAWASAKQSPVKEEHKTGGGKLGRFGWRKEKYADTFFKYVVFVNNHNMNDWSINNNIF